MSGLNKVVDRNSGVDLLAGDPLVRLVKLGRVRLPRRVINLSLLLLLAFLLSPILITQALGATLTVQLPGGGTGSVSSSQGGISCPGTCSAILDPGTPVTLSAFPNDNSIFSGWGGACAGMENCAVTLASDMTVTALFTPKSSPVHVSGAYYGALQKAYDTVAAGGVVMAVAQDQPGDFTLNRGISFTIKGGYDDIFSSNPGVTKVNGTVSLGTGSMTVENIAIGQSVSSPTAAPSGIVATAGNGQVSLVWNSMPGAASYNIYYSSSIGVSRATGTKVTGTSVVTGLTNGTTYYFVVTALSVNGESVESNQVIATPIQPAPAAPTGVSATAGNGQVSVSWTPVSGATSYNIYYNTSSAVSKTNGTSIAGNVNPKVISLANNNTYYFVVTAVNSGGESTESSPPVPATPVVPPSADAVGTWNFLRFAAGPDVASGSEPGWMRGNATIAANGAVTVNSMLDSSGNSATPPVGTFAFSMDANGIVTQVGDNALDPGNHAVMATNKQIVAGNGNHGSDRVIFVFVKQVSGVTFSNADLTNKNFVYHQLSSSGSISGSSNVWQYGAGTVDGSRNVNLSSVTDPTGTTTNVGIVDSITLSNAGIMTSTSGSGNHEEGVMTPDKRAIFVTETQTDGQGNYYTLRVIQMTGQTFTQSDLAGTWRIHTLVSSSSAPFWEYDLDSVSITGLVTHVATLDSTGNTIPSSGTPTLLLDATGIITRTGTPKHGQLSYNKDIAVMTDTKNGLYSLAIGFKQ